MQAARPPGGRGSGVGSRESKDVFRASFAVTTHATLVFSSKNNRMTIYQRLIAWQRAMDLVVEIYDVSKNFPDQERYGLTAQLCRAAVSVPSNIAEGRGRGSRADYRRFLLQARGSLYEVQTQLLIANRLNYVSDVILQKLMESSTSVIQLVSGLIRSLAPTPDSRPPTP